MRSVRRPDRRPTILDVAHLAGVSKATVSRVLNDNPGVAAEKVAAVLHVVEEIGYVPSLSAVSLARGRALSIGLLAPALSRPWMLEILRGVTEAIENTDFSLTLYTMSSGMSSLDALRSRLRRQAIDGLAIMQPPDSGEDLGRLFEGVGVPVVVIDDRGAHRNLPSVGSTDEQGITDAVNHLLELGLTRIAMLAGPQHIPCHRDRLAAYRLALRSAGVGEDLVIACDDDSYQAGGRGVDLLLTGQHGIHAVVAGNDALALGAIRRIKQLGHRIPQDISVTGFDDVAAARYSDPPLTTIYNPLYEMGGAAVRLLLAACKGEALPSKPVLLPTKLIVRASTVATSADESEDDLVHWFAANSPI